MRYVFCALLLGCSLLAQNESAPKPTSGDATGTFYVDGIAYQYAIGSDYTVVAAAHSVINHKFLAVKVRVYNVGTRSVTVKPEAIGAEDAADGRAVASIPGAELAKKMRRPYNMARYAVNSIGGESTDSPVTSDMVSPQFVEMMRAMAARTGSGSVVMPGGKNLLYTDTPGALESRGAVPLAAECDQVCRLRNRETDAPDALTQLQRQTSPDYVEQCAFLANTVPPHGNIAGIFYYPLGKLSASGDHGRKGRLVRLTVPVGVESFQFVLEAE